MNQNHLRLVIPGSHISLLSQKLGSVMWDFRREIYFSLYNEDFQKLNCVCITHADCQNDALHLERMIKEETHRKMKKSHTKISTCQSIHKFPFKIFLCHCFWVRMCVLYEWNTQLGVWNWFLLLFFPILTVFETLQWTMTVWNSITEFMNKFNLLGAVEN